MREMMAQLGAGGGMLSKIPGFGNLAGAASGLTWALTILGLRWLGRSETEGGTDSTGQAVVAGNLIACVVCLPLALPVTQAGATGGDINIQGQSNPLVRSNY